jgi:hypothetical protein
MSSGGWWATHRLLSWGRRGPDVEALQRALNKEAIPSQLTVTGTFDNETEEAVKAFQRRYSLVDDGRVGPIMQSILFIGHYRFAISEPPRVMESEATCWAAALQSVLHSKSWGNRPRWTIADLIRQYRLFLERSKDITIENWYKIGADLALRHVPLRGKDLRLEQVVWLLRENRMPIVMVHDMTGLVRHTVVIYGVSIEAGAPKLLVMDPMYGHYATIGADVLRSHARKLIITMPEEAKHK